MSKISLVFFGTPEIAVNSFVSLVRDLDFEVKALVTQPDRPNSRGKKIIVSNIKQEAKKAGIPIFEPVRISKDDNIIEKLRVLTPDFFVTFAFGQILSQKILDIPKIATINLHASLLPKYRGANPICECLLNGDCETGITTMKTVLELDAGDICLTEKIKINEESNFVTLSKEISELSPDLIKKTLIGLKEGTILPARQNSLSATFTRKTQKKDKLLDFTESATALHNKVRAYFGCNTTHFFFNNKVVKVLCAQKKEENGSPCEILRVNKDGILVACNSGSLLIKEVKPEGKNAMPAYDWSLGSKIRKGDKIQ